MACVLSVKFGATPAITVTVEDEAKAADYFRDAWREFIGEPTSATDAQKVKAVMKRWIADDVRKLKLSFVAGNLSTVQQQADDKYNLQET